MFIDSHCHLHFPELSKDLDGIVSRARTAGLGRMVTVATNRKGFDEALAIANAYDDVYCTVGVHPHHAADEGQDITSEEIVAFANKPKVVGIGEAGLDYFYDLSPRDTQKEIFRRHIRAARIAHLPLIIHTRQAEEDTIQLLQEEGIIPGVLHCFSSRRMLAEFGLENGFFISASGILTFKKSQEVRDIFRDVPLDRLLIETDAPYLAPGPHRGKICEPAHVLETAKMLAEVKGVSLEEIEHHTTENFFRLFRKCAKAAS